MRKFIKKMMKVYENCINRESFVYQKNWNLKNYRKHYSCRFCYLLFHALVKNINAHRKGLVQSILATIDTVKSRVSTLAAQPSIESACPLATYSRDYRRINPLDQRFPFPGQRRPGLNLSLSFQLDRSTRHIPCNRISRKKYPFSPRIPRFRFVCKCEQSGIRMYIRVYSNRRIRG